MAFKLKSSHLIALAITAGIAGWMAVGEVDLGGGDGPQAAPIADRETEKAGDPFKVQFFVLKPESRNEEILVRGRTEANAVVEIRTETAGLLQERLVNKGDLVAEGQTVCRIESGTREAEVARAEAALAQAEADYEANAALQKQGFASDNRLNQLKAALNAARSGLAAAKWELERTSVVAKASGIVQDPIAEAGTMLTMGGVCVTLIDTDPMMFIGQVSEREINKVRIGQEAPVALVSGQVVEGKVRYIAPSADPQTRTFRVEIELPNGDGSIRDGVTASATIRLEPSMAFRVSPSWVSLAADGRIGLKTLDEANTVKFVPIQLLAQTPEGFWISGPQANSRIITLGQEYVVEGETVTPVPDPALLAVLQDGNDAAEGAKQ